MPKPCRNESEILEIYLAYLKYCVRFMCEKIHALAHNLKVAGSNTAPATNHRANNLASPKN